MPVNLNNLGVMLTVCALDNKLDSTCFPDCNTMRSLLNQSVF